jgi:hypothetical protein
VSETVFILGVRVRAVLGRIRFFAAVDNDVVVGSRRTWRFYTHAVIHHGASGPFATFHLSTEGAKKGLQAFRATAPDKRLVRTIETSTLLPVGSRHGGGER